MMVRNIKRPRQFLTLADVGFILGLLVLIGGLFIFNLYVARTLKGGEWLYLRWGAARAVMFENIDPYGSTIAQRVQLVAYGREAYLNEYPYVLDDPFYIVLLYTPFGLLSLIADFPVAHAIWMLLSQAALVAVVILSLRLSEWEPPFWMLLFLVGFALLGSFSVLSFLSGSSAIFIILLALLILTAIQAGADEIAGVLLFLIAYQWEISAFFIVFLIIYVIANRRWGVLSGFGMTMAILMVLSLLVNSGWIVPYVRAVLLDRLRGTDYTFATTLSYIFPAITNSPDRWIALIAAAILLIETIGAVFEHSRHIVWVAFLALALTPMLGFAIFPTNQVVLLPCLIMIVTLVWERWIHQRVWVSLLLLAAIFSASYWLYFQVLETQFRLYSDLMKILPPLVMVLGLYWMRWWAIRPPRLWADQIGIRK